MAEGIFVALRRVADAGKNADELVDAGKNGVYNGIRQAGNIELKPDDLMEELAASGVKYTKEDVILVTRNSDGDLLWLETGNEEAGLQHILDGHKGDFKDMENPTENIPTLLKSILDTEPCISGINDKGPFSIFSYGGKDYLVAYGTNGFIVSFYPYSTD